MRVVLTESKASYMDFLLLDIKGLLSEATSNAAFPPESAITGLFWRCPESASTRNSFVFVIKKPSPQ